MLTVQQLSFGYTAQPIVFGSLNVNCGQWLAVLGPNGAGKTTLLELLAGLLRPTHGRMVWDTTNIHQCSAEQRATQLAFVPAHTPRDFPLRVSDVVHLGRLPYRGTAQAADDSRIVASALADMDLTEFDQRDIQTLSSGEWQRVVIARALAQTPQLLLLDEPIAHLDPPHQYKVMELLHRKQQAGLTIISSLHDVNLAQRYCTDACLIQPGHSLHTGPIDQQLTADRLAALYGIPMQTELQWTVQLP